ncbi:3-hydroxyisobutyrate dehydrogenase, putative [Ricinus communis]|uniref:3-hydroxyisobutyrate dehydrogenase, putative n=1 Tax=Ricinus communis TaxID=3988 RepID=B9RKH5_RICCO|nr:3-hydroxyisobutyrate dehydrogenase, putative [Ricinus communis]
MPLSLLRRSLSHHHHHQYYLISFPLFLHRSMATTTTTATESVGPSNTRVGWIGTGVMGRSMCSHLIKAGYTLTIFNRTLSKAQPLVDMGANLADSPLSVASASDVVFSIVGFPSDVRHVLLDSTTGALQGLRPGGVLIDMTTSDPSLAAEISAAASAKNCHSIDAPVSGGDRGAKNGTLAIFAGGDKAVIDSFICPLRLTVKAIWVLKLLFWLSKGLTIFLFNNLASANLVAQPDHFESKQPDFQIWVLLLETTFVVSAASQVTNLWFYPHFDIYRIPSSNLMLLWKFLA